MVRIKDYSMNESPPNVEKANVEDNFLDVRESQCIPRYAFSLLFYLVQAIASLAEYAIQKNIPIKTHFYPSVNVLALFDSFTTSA